MNKKRFSLILIAAVAIVAAAIAIFAWTRSASTPTHNTDEITGTWHAEGTTKDNYTWFVDYTFENGTYSMKTESAFKDNGTYEITKRYEDGVSLDVRKTSIPFNQTYDIVILKQSDSTIAIDGMTLTKQP